MKKTVEEHAARFTEKAAAYDDDKRPEYHACCSLVVDHADGSASRTSRGRSTSSPRTSRSTISTTTPNARRSGPSPISNPGGSSSVT